MLWKDAISRGTQYRQDMKVWGSLRSHGLDSGLDVAFVALAVGAQAEIWLRDEARLQPALVVLTLVWTLAPLARRQFPFAAPMVALFAMALMSFVADEYPASAATTFVGIMLLAWIVSAYNEPRLAAVGLITIYALLVVVIARDPSENGPDSIGVGLFVTASWAVGIGWYRRAQHTAEIEARAERAEQEREARARVAVAEERSRIARELHDVVAHSVSVMVLQTSGVRRLLRPEQESERDALVSVEQTGREALAEMRRLLGVLRPEGEDAELAPAPGLDNLDRLISQVRAAGLPVELQIEGDPAPLPAGIDLSAYRIVQEGLTNALKHAGPAHASVVVRYGEDDVEIEVADDGSGPADIAGGGYGLAGMTERVKLFGGEFESGPRNGGGFVLRARLPMPTAAPS